jgi:hypothetical protein
MNRAEAYVCAAVAPCEIDHTLGRGIVSAAVYVEANDTITFSDGFGGHSAELR